MASERADAPALERAADAGVRTAVFPLAAFPDRPARGSSSPTGYRNEAELVVLAATWRC